MDRSSHYCIGKGCWECEKLKRQAESAVALSDGVIKPDGEWINVKEKLPSVGDAVIAAMKVEEERDRFEGWWFGCCIYREYGFPWVKFDNPHPIEYWMPLPEPPKAL